LTVSELALTESPALRAQYADRVDVLDKVKALLLLPGDIWGTTEIVADYYEVDRKTIEKLVQRNLTELSGNGYRVIEGDELTDMKSVCGIASRARSLALFSRRAILNVGQLLRDSDVAQEVRSTLLDIEEASAAVEVHTPRSLPEALRAYANELEAHDRTRALLAEARPLAEAYRDLMSKDGTFDWAATAQIFSGMTGGLGRNRFLELLRDLAILKANNTPYQRYMKHFKVVGDTAGPNATPTTTVKPAGLDWLRARLIAHFFKQGSLFAIGGAA
jgi:phage antirepressor YoqD-like protein